MEQEELHEHSLEDGTILRHSHGQGGHKHAHTKAVLNRMSRLIGHLESIRRMIEKGQDCSEVLVQLSAVDAAIRGVGRIIIKDHMEHCIVDVVRNGDQETIDRMNEAIDRFLR